MSLSLRTPARVILALAILPLSYLVFAREQAAAVTTSAGSGVAPIRLAYATGTARSPSAVWVADSSGREARRLGLGSEPLPAPSGQSVAASLFGATTNSEQGPALVIYSTLGATAVTYLSLATATATPLAWSPDSRYLAVSLQSTSLTNTANHSALAVIDTSTGCLPSSRVRTQAKRGRCCCPRVVHAG
jgi:hypothetical protein